MQDHCSLAGDLLLTHLLQQLCELGLIPLHYSALTEPSHDPWSLVEGTKHDACSSTLRYMRDGLNSGARRVDVSDSVRVKDMKSRGRQAFRTQIDVLSGERGKGYEEDLLHGPF